MQSMRELIDAVNSKKIEPLSEGIIDMIRSWASSFTDPVKISSKSYLHQFIDLAKNEYGASVPNTVKSANKEWYWSKITYNDLYEFINRSIGISAEELDKILKNKIIINYIKKINASMPEDITIPDILTTAYMKNTKLPISPIATSTKEFLSKSLVELLIDSCAYLEYYKNLKSKTTQKDINKLTTTTSPIDVRTNNNNNNNNNITPDSTQNSVNSNIDISTAIRNIRQGLESLKSGNNNGA